MRFTLKAEDNGERWMHPRCYVTALEQRARLRDGKISTRRTYQIASPSVAQAAPRKKRIAFFGKLTGEEWGELMYKHIDHHLRQFDA